MYSLMAGLKVRIFYQRFLGDSSQRLYACERNFWKRLFATYA